MVGRDRVGPGDRRDPGAVVGTRRRRVQGRLQAARDGVPDGLRPAVARRPVAAEQPERNAGAARRERHPGGRAGRLHQQRQGRRLPRRGRPGRHDHDAVGLGGVHGHRRQGREHSPARAAQPAQDGGDRRGRLRPRPARRQRSEGGLRRSQDAAIGAARDRVHRRRLRRRRRQAARDLARAVRLHRGAADPRRRLPDARRHRAAADERGGRARRRSRADRDPHACHAGRELRARAGHADGDRGRGRLRAVHRHATPAQPAGRHGRRGVDRPSHEHLRPRCAVRRPSRSASPSWACAPSA